eukprot:SAG31_NODE_48298_length_195_cov_28.239583_1_plen_31_part_01
MAEWIAVERVALVVVRWERWASAESQAAVRR